MSNGHHVPKIAQFSIGTHNLQSTVPKYDNIFSKNNKAKIPRLKPPYRKRDLDRFEDTFRSDGDCPQWCLKEVELYTGFSYILSLSMLIGNTRTMMTGLLQ